MDGDLIYSYNLTSREAAELLRCNPQMLYKWRRRKFGPKPLKIGKRYRYSAQEISKWLKDYNEWAKEKAW